MSPVPRANDVSSTKDVETLFTETVQRFGKIDLVVAKAGIEIINEPILEATEAQ